MNNLAEPIDQPTTGASLRRAAYVADVLETATSPALDRLSRATHAVSRGLGLDGDTLEDVVLVVDECTYQAARTLRADGAVELPNLGRLEIRYGDDGPVGRFIPSADLNPRCDQEQP